MLVPTPVHRARQLGDVLTTTTRRQTREISLLRRLPAAPNAEQRVPGATLSIHPQLADAPSSSAPALPEALVHIPADHAPSALMAVPSLPNAGALGPAGGSRRTIPVTGWNSNKRFGAGFSRMHPAWLVGGSAVWLPRERVEFTDRQQTIRDGYVLRVDGERGLRPRPAGWPPRPRSSPGRPRTCRGRMAAAAWCSAWPVSPDTGAPVAGQHGKPDGELDEADEPLAHDVPRVGARCARSR
jgi:hypothetical protein